MHSQNKKASHICKKLNLLMESDNVFRLSSDNLIVTREHIDFIKSIAAKSELYRARICLHHSHDSTLHEMIIALTSNSYIRPHKHNNKSESFWLVEGEVDVFIFSDTGKVIRKVVLSAAEGHFFRINNSDYHSVVVRSDMAVLHEVTTGPFSLSSSQFASFAPNGENRAVVDNYLQALSF